MVYLVSSLLKIEGKIAFYKPEEIEPAQLKKLMHVYGWQSYIQDKRTAEIASRVLEMDIEASEKPLELNESIDIENTFIVWVFVSRIIEEDILMCSFLITTPVLIEV